jgi:hypothetical protein
LGGVKVSFSVLMNINLFYSFLSFVVIFIAIGDGKILKDSGENVSFWSLIKIYIGDMQ